MVTWYFSSTLVLRIAASRSTLTPGMPVVVAVSSYERNQNYNKTMSQQLELGSMVFSTIDGANFRLMGTVGARIAKVPDVTMLGFKVPGEEQEDGSPLTRSAMQPIGLPHVIIVNRAGKRFGNEAFYRNILMNVDLIDGNTQTHPNFPCWAVLDSQAREKYPFGSVMPGMEFPEGMAAKADTLAELAAQIGVDPQGLEATVAAFNAPPRRHHPDWSCRRASRLHGMTRAQATCSSLISARPTSDGSTRTSGARSHAV